MSKVYPMEALLRPPVEFFTAFSAAGAAFIAGVAPWALMMTPSVGTATALVLSVLAVVRTREGWRILRYQRSLRKLPDYRLSVAKTPVSATRLFLGQGFLWTQQHTQRLRDTQRPKVRHYLQHGILYRWARQLEVHHEKNIYFMPSQTLF